MGEFASALDDHLAVPLSAYGDAELLERIEADVVAIRRLQASVLAGLAEARVRDAIDTQTGRTARNWLVEELRVGPGQAGRLVAWSRKLALFPALAAAFAAGELSEEHLQVLLGVLAPIPPSEQRDALEQALLDLAVTGTTGALLAAVTETKARLGLGEAAEAAAERRRGERHLTADRSFDGSLIGRYALPAEAGTALLAALEVFMTPTGAEDDRSLAQRRADALTALAEAHLAHADDLPQCGGERPRVVVTMTLDQLLGSLTDRVLGLGGQAPIGGDWAAAPARLPATVAGPGDTAWPITARAARRIACDAEIIPAVLGAGGEILDYGRATRAWTTAQRRAVQLRDGRGCAFGGCDHPYVELHHIQWWSNGGTTDIDNAAQLCLYHHDLIHHRGWTLTRNNGDGSFTFTGPHGQTRHFPRRNTRSPLKT